MLKTERMKQVVVAGAKPQLVPVIENLQRLRALHIEEHEPDEFFTYGDPLPEGERVAEARLTARGLIKSLGLEDAVGTPPGPAGLESWDQAAAAIEEIDDAATGLIEEREQTRSRLREAETHAARLKRLAPLGLRLEHLHGYRNVAVLLGTTSSDPQPLIGRHLGDHQLHKTGEEAGFLIALFVRVDQQKDAENLLAQAGFSELETPEGEGTIDGAAGAAVREARRIRSQLEDLENRLDAARKTHGGRLLAAERVLAVAAERANAPLRFATSKHGFVITGYVPERRMQATEKALMAATGHSIHVEWHEPGESRSHGAPHNPDASHEAHKETTPEAQPPSMFAHKRKGPASFTQMLTLHSWPKYKEIDPTVLIYVTFPLFFAVMIGDLAFGVLIMLVAAYLYRKPLFGIGGPRVGRMLMLAGFWTAFFGVFVYQEAFGIHFIQYPGTLSWEAILAGAGAWGGYKGAHGLELATVTYQIAGRTIETHYISKLGNVELLLGISFAIAVVHLNLSLLLGVYNQWILHGPKHAILARVSWLVMELGIIGLAWGGASGDSTIMLAGGAVLAVAIVMIIAGEGIVGALELPKLVSNAASYFRLAAVAMSKAGMALAVNTFAFTAVAGTTSYAVAGIGGWVLLIVGHLIILALGIIAGGLHSMRLQLVEFFGWFFEGGGRPFKAFGDPRNLP